MQEVRSKWHLLTFQLISSVVWSPVAKTFVKVSGAEKATIEKLRQLIRGKN
jgi:hypothetical protein